MGGLLVLGISFVGVCVVDLLNLPARRIAAPIPSTSPPIASGLEKQGKPWGDLEISDIQIDPPDEYASKLYVPTNHGSWFFGSDFDRSKILNLFQSADLTESQRSELINSARWETTAQGTVITPEPRTVFGLSRAARSRIYRVLAGFPENFFQASPFMFPRNRADDWCFHCGLSPQTISLVSSLLYERGNMLCFSDVQFLGQIGSDEEKTRLITTLSRAPAVLVNLRIQPGTDPGPLIQYWCQPVKVNGARHLIKSLARGGNAGTIDITRLLPPFVREHLYIYPGTRMDPAIKAPDSFWSALSFNREPPDPTVVNETYLVNRLKEDYEPVQGPFQLGDVLVFENQDGRIAHTSVYIAGDIVFTKNGASLFSPWVLMRFQDVLGFYSNDLEPRVKCFRPKTTSQKIIGRR